MDINWFPGHMAKSTREIESELKSSDLVIYVLDSRAVRSCFNPNFDRIISVPIVYVLGKADTAPESAVNGWVRKLSRGENIAVAIDATSSGCRKSLLSAIKKAGAGRLEKQRAQRAPSCACRGRSEHGQVDAHQQPLRKSSACDGRQGGRDALG